MRSHRRLPRDILIGLGITVLLLAILETGLHLLSRYIKTRLTIWDYQQMDSLRGFTLRPNFRYAGVQINSLGFRGAEFQPIKPVGVFRIVALGDSVTFGGQDDPERPYPLQLERFLNGHRPSGCGFTYEVINGGVQGYRADNALVRLRADVLPIQPDLVIVSVGWNDLFAVDPERLQKPVDPGDYFNWLLRQSLLLTEVTRLIFSRVRPRFETVTPERVSLYEAFVPEDFSKEYQRIVHAAHSGGVRIVVVTLAGLMDTQQWESRRDILHFPHFTHSARLLGILVGRYNDAIWQVAGGSRTLLVDWQAAVRKWPGAAASFVDSMHMDRAGYGFMARVIASELNRRGLLPCAVAADPVH